MEVGGWRREEMQEVGANKKCRRPVIGCMQMSSGNGNCLHHSRLDRPLFKDPPCLGLVLGSLFRLLALSLELENMISLTSAIFDQPRSR